MASRRMFSKSITNSSTFMMMSQTAQLLYFQLGMNADDDGFCEHFSIMRLVAANPDDLKILMAKELVHVFDDKVLVIMDWKENNYIQNDRYRPSKYLAIYSKELQALSQVEGKKPDCIQNVYKMDTQVRLGKVRLGKVIHTIEGDGFAEFWKSYPNKKGKKEAGKAWAKIKPSAELLEKIMSALEQHKNSKQWLKDDGSYIPHPATWLNQERWNDEVKVEQKKIHGSKYDAVEGVKV